MTEINDIEQIEEISLENKQLEQIEVLIQIHNLNYH